MTFLSTHPASEKRMAHLRELSVTKNGEYKNMNHEFAILKATVKEFVENAPAEAATTETLTPETLITKQPSTEVKSTEVKSTEVESTEVKTESTSTVISEKESTNEGKH